MIKVWNRAHVLHVLRRIKTNQRKEISTYLIIYDTRRILPTKERHNVQCKEKRTTIKEAQPERPKKTFLEARETARISNRE